MTSRLKKLAKHPRLATPRRCGSILTMTEELESRILLSGVAKPDFLILSRSVNRFTFDGVNGLTPAIVRAAYGVSQTTFGSVAANGAGQTIAIVDAYNAPTITSDLQAFDAMYGLPNPTLTRINENGGTSLPGDDPAGAGNSWAVETSLDVEWAHAIAPDANIVLVLASSDSMTDLMKAVNTARSYAGVSVVSMSWGGDESSSDTSYNSDFTTPSGHTGVTFLAASGDGGAYGSNGFTKTVGYPAASPNVIGVGGTTLNTDNNGDYLSESGWGSGSSSAINGGSGGGLSRYESQPSYQRGVVTQSTTQRAVPDVSLDADPNSGVPVVDSYDFGNTAPQVIGGTSLATPMWAGIIALADQGRALSGLGTMDGATQTLPALYALPSSDFHDITTGNNGYAAGPGYDLVTGRGTPIVNKLVPGLVGTTPAPTSGVPSIGSFTVSPSSAVSGTAITFTAANVTETGGTVSTVKFYRESNGQSGLQTGSDTLVGTGVKNGTTWTLTISTTGMAGGSYTYYAVATDTANVSSAASSATLSIVTPTIGSFTVSPNATTAGTSVTFTASNVTEAAGGTISSVQIYRESNSQSGWQSTDTLVGSATLSAGAWTFTTSTTGLAVGNYTFYAVATDGTGLTAAASTTLTIQSTTPTPTPTPTPTGNAPANDNFVNGTVLTGSSVTATGTNVNATRESGEPYITGNMGGHSVWWTWTAPASGTAIIDTHGSNFDTTLGVYTGNAVNALTLVAANDDDPTMYTLTSRVVFQAVAGTTYHIAVDGYNGATGNITLHVNEAQAPANDNFANATVFNGGIWTGSNVGATKEPGEPSLAGNLGGSSVWLVWTPATTGVVTINTEGSNFDTMLGVYTGSAVNALSLVAANDDVSYFDRTSSVTFTAVAGTTYHIRIDGYNGAQGSIVLYLA